MSLNARARRLMAILVLAAACGTKGENAIVMGVPLAPARPSPWSGELGVVPGTPLRWAPAEGAVSYVVRWGTNESTPNVLASPSTNVCNPPPDLAAGARVFWRVDAVNPAGVTAGPVWEFKVAGTSTFGDGTALPPDESYEASLWGASSRASWHFGRELHVDGRSNAASDNNAGTAAAPLKTIGRALALAGTDGKGTRIVVHPGTYREGINVNPEASGSADSPLLIEADPPGQAVLLGTDEWTGWTLDAGSVYYKPFTLGWGVAPQDEDWPPIAELGRRREMVFVDGQLYRQVLTKAELKAGTYAVDDTQDRLYVWFPSDPAQHSVEVSVRDFGIYLGHQWVNTSWPSYIAVRGFVVRGFEESTLVGRHIVAEDCRFEWNDGIVWAGGEDYVLRRNRVLHSGKLGIEVPPQTYGRHLRGVLEDNETAYGNWRWGDLGGLTTYSVAGVKVHSADQVIVRGHVSRRNNMPGLWFDSVTRNVLVESSVIEDNLGPGLWFEVAPGATVARNNIITRNQIGIQLGYSSHVSLLGNLVYDNADAQVLASSAGTPERVTQRLSYLHVIDNVVGATAARAASRYVSLPEWEYLYFGETAVVVRGNSYSGSSLTQPFHVAGGDYDATGWVARTREAGSDMAPFAFRGPAVDDFVPVEDSPLLNKRGWSWVDVRVGTELTMSATPAAPIRFTLDGTAPTAASTLYTNAISTPASATVRARAIGYELWSPIVTLPRFAP